MDTMLCDRCGGEGFEYSDSVSEVGDNVIPCPKCRGTGEIDIEFEYQGEEP